jgi:hypothetical protein
MNSLSVDRARDELAATHKAYRDAEARLEAASAAQISASQQWDQARTLYELAKTKLIKAVIGDDDAW